MFSLRLEQMLSSKSAREGEREMERERTYAYIGKLRTKKRQVKYSWADNLNKLIKRARQIVDF